MRHGVGLSTSSDSELITQLLAFTPPTEELDAPNWVARFVSSSDDALNISDEIQDFRWALQD